MESVQEHAQLTALAIVVVAALACGMTMQRLRQPAVLGYNKVTPRDDATVLVKVGDDPLVVVGEVGEGRCMAFTTDCGPHWAPPPFVDWDGYARFWAQAMAWLHRG